MSEVYWQAEVEAYGKRSPEHYARVTAAMRQVNMPDAPLNDQWEAVYTLIRQAEQMEGVQEVFEP